MGWCWPSWLGPGPPSSWGPSAFFVASRDDSRSLSQLGRDCACYDSFHFASLSAAGARPPRRLRSDDAYRQRKVREGQGALRRNARGEKLANPQSKGNPLFAPSATRLAVTQPQENRHKHGFLVFLPVGRVVLAGVSPGGPEFAILRTTARRDLFWGGVVSFLSIPETGTPRVFVLYCQKKQSFWDDISQPGSDGRDAVLPCLYALTELPQQHRRLAVMESSLRSPLCAFLAGFVALRMFTLLCTVVVRTASAHIVGVAFLFYSPLLGKRRMLYARSPSTRLWILALPPGNRSIKSVMRSPHAPLSYPSPGG